MFVCSNVVVMLVTLPTFVAFEQVNNFKHGLIGVCCRVAEISQLLCSEASNVLKYWIALGTYLTASSTEV